MSTHFNQTCIKIIPPNPPALLRPSKSSNSPFRIHSQGKNKIVNTKQVMKSLKNSYFFQKISPALKLTPLNAGIRGPPPVPSASTPRKHSTTLIAIKTISKAKTHFTFNAEELQQLQQYLFPFMEDYLSKLGYASMDLENNYNQSENVNTQVTSLQTQNTAVQINGSPNGAPKQITHLNNHSNTNARQSNIERSRRDSQRRGEGRENKIKQRIKTAFQQKTKQNNMKENEERTQKEISNQVKKKSNKRDATANLRVDMHIKFLELALHAAQTDKALHSKIKQLLQETNFTVPTTEDNHPQSNTIKSIINKAKLQITTKSLKIEQPLSLNVVPTLSKYASLEYKQLKQLQVEKQMVLQKLDEVINSKNSYMNDQAELMIAKEQEIGKFMQQYEEKTQQVQSIREELQVFTLKKKQMQEQIAQLQKRTIVLKKQVQQTEIHKQEVNQSYNIVCREVIQLERKKEEFINFEKAHSEDQITKKALDYKDLQMRVFDFRKKIFATASDYDKAALPFLRDQLLLELKSIINKFMNPTNNRMNLNSIKADDMADFLTKIQMFFNKSSHIYQSLVDNVAQCLTEKMQYVTHSIDALEDLWKEWQHRKISIEGLKEEYYVSEWKIEDLIEKVNASVSKIIDNCEKMPNKSFFMLKSEKERVESKDKSEKSIMMASKGSRKQTMKANQSIRSIALPPPEPKVDFQMLRDEAAEECGANLTKLKKEINKIKQLYLLSILYI